MTGEVAVREGGVVQAVKTRHSTEITVDFDGDGPPEVRVPPGVHVNYAGDRSPADPEHEEMAPDGGIPEAEAGLERRLEVETRGSGMSKQQAAATGGLGGVALLVAGWAWGALETTVVGILVMLAAIPLLYFGSRGYWNPPT